MPGPPPGAYSIYSIFKKSINLYNQSENYLLTVGYDIPPGPHTIIIEEEPFKNLKKSLNNLKKVEVFSKKNSIIINKNKLIIDNNSIFYDSRINLKYINPSDFEKFYNNFLFLSGGKGISPLLFILENEKIKISAKQMIIVKKILNGFKLIQSQNIEEGVKEIIGTGPGYTPSGDDFIAGLIFYLYCFKNNSNFFNIFKSFSIPYALNRTNIVSYNFIRNSASGLVNKIIKEFIYNLNSPHYLKKVILLGHTSGIDFLTGFGAGKFLLKII